MTQFVTFFFFFYTFSLSSNSYHTLPDVAQILLHLQQQTSALGRYSWPRMFNAEGWLGLLALGSPRKASIPNDFSFSFWELTITERLNDIFIKLPLLERLPLQKLCSEMCGFFSFFFLLHCVTEVLFCFRSAQCSSREFIRISEKCALLSGCYRLSVIASLISLCSQELGFGDFSLHTRRSVFKKMMHA